MDSQVLKFFSHQRQIFGICPCCDELFRLSDCKVYRNENPPADWKEKIEKEIAALDRLEERLDEKMEGLREKERAKGRILADKKVKKIDTVFSPQKLNPDDSKVIFHPIDFIVFNGMKSSETGVKNLILLDSKAKTPEGKAIQKSIIRSIEKESYEWLTLRVEEDGKVAEE